MTSTRRLGDLIRRLAWFYALGAAGFFVASATLVVVGLGTPRVEVLASSASSRIALPGYASGVKLYAAGPDVGRATFDCAFLGDSDSTVGLAVAEPTSPRRITVDGEVLERVGKVRGGFRAGDEISCPGATALAAARSERTPRFLQAALCAFAALGSAGFATFGFVSRRGAHRSR